MARATCFRYVAKPHAITARFMSSKAGSIRIGFVPEHFSTPLHFATTKFGLSADLTEFPQGTGHMIESLKSNEIDVGIGLTEGWVAGLSKAKTAGSALPYQIVGSYVKSPLCWAISTGSMRDISRVEQLRGCKIGVSRIGSGSYVMPFVLADQLGWLDGETPFEFIPLGTFKALRAGVNDETADAFMWEHFTSKRYYDNGEIKRIGEIYTPWASWKIVAKDPNDERLKKLFESLNQGISHFRDNQEEAVKYISTNLDYSAEDAREWLKTVEFVDDTANPGKEDISKTIDILGKAGVLDSSTVSTKDMIQNV